MLLFISYSNKDEKVALAVCSAIERMGTRCWIASRDIRAGDRWSSTIIGAIDQCDALVVIFSSNANDSDHVHREVEYAFNQKRRIIPFRVENVLPTGSLAYFMGGLHWVDAFQLPLETSTRHLESAARGAPVNLRPEAELRSEDISADAAADLAERTRQIVVRESTHADHSDRPHYLCYISKGKLDNFLVTNQWQIFRDSSSRLPVDLDRTIETNMRFGVRQTYDSELQVYVEKLRQVLRRLEPFVRPFKWEDSQNLAADGLDILWGRLAFSLNYAEPNPIAVLIASNGDQKLHLHCSVSNFSGASKNGTWFGNSMTNAIMSSGGAFTFETVFFATGTYRNSVIGSPLYLKAPITSFGL